MTSKTTNIEGRVFLKRGRWIAQYKGRSFKFETKEEADLALENFNLNGLPDR